MLITSVHLHTAIYEFGTQIALHVAHLATKLYWNQLKIERVIVNYLTKF